MLASTMSWLITCEIKIEAGKGDTENVPNVPAQVIISRVLFALLISVSLVINMLLVLAVIRRRRSVHVVYMLATAMIVPDLIFYVKVIAELVDWSVDAGAVPSWASTDAACGLWQFASHAYPGIPKNRLLFKSIFLRNLHYGIH